MPLVSVVIITCNEEANITACIQSARLVSDDIIVVDAGSTDATVQLAASAGATTINLRWENFGSSRNAGAAAASHNWVLALDADERIVPELALVIQSITKTHLPGIYGFRRESFFAGKRIRFGTWGRDKVFRLYDKRYSRWDTSPVHEKLVPGNIPQKLLPFQLVHFPVKQAADFTEKMQRYAFLTAAKYYQQNKSSNLVKRLFAPVYVFIQSYLLLLGFLDGKEGFVIARQLAWYTRLKYLHLAHLRKENASHVAGMNFEISIKPVL